MKITKGILKTIELAEMLIIANEISAKDAIALENFDELEDSIQCNAFL
ncbi:hypothetical protein [Nostoc cycadae]|uniref:Uncharacterized protein n=1 Tax=Nostoc cycadae WK-1 TaxID=1861711 RepID=A0A2H6LFN0_9NOSO|nr:hypothetical protein [Nostoc cycadae]GBE92020.1 hypothetical protein NCWK1_1773 [Nostoc cycadae WK-1]